MLREYKVHIFWEGHKILRNLHLAFVLQYVVPVKNKVKISQNFLAFSEYMNFMYLQFEFGIIDNSEKLEFFIICSLEFGIII